MNDIRLSKITFVNGAKDSSTKLTIDVPNILLIVGPNNCGKSKALREIESWCNGTQFESLVVESVSCIAPNGSEEALSYLDRLRSNLPSQNSATIRVDQIGSTGGVSQYEIPSNHLSGFSGSRLSREVSLRQAYLSKFLLIMRTESAIKAVLNHPASPLTKNTPTSNIKHQMLQDPTLRRQIQKTIFDSIGFWLSVSILNQPDLSFYLSEEEPSSNIQESIGEEAKDYFDNRAYLARFSGSGYQAFIGFVSVLLASHQQIVTLDEPETYLHPPLIRKLAGIFAKEIVGRNGTGIIATHSSDFVSSCLENTHSIGVVRLTYDGKNATSMSLSPDDLAPFLRDPIIRNSKAIDGLFHESVVVTEGDTDRVFYSEVNRRLNTVGRGVNDSLFVHAGSWTNVFRVIGPLRKIGIPAIGIVDIDVFMGTGNWIDLQYFEKLCVPEDDQQRLQNLIEECRTILNNCRTVGGAKKPEPLFKTMGMFAFSPSDTATVAEAIKELEAYGLFVVWKGSLESWLNESVPKFGIGKPKWFELILERLSRQDGEHGYIPPIQEDVWSFMDQIELWCKNTCKTDSN